MDNQHKLIKGYRELNQHEIDVMNAGKALATQVGEWIEILDCDPTTDHRWLAIAKTDLQKGFMAAIRAIAQPTTF